jgi:hypothetical protein
LSPLKLKKKFHRQSGYNRKDWYSHAHSSSTVKPVRMN